MSWLIVPVTVLLLRGAFAVLLLAGAESIGGDYLSARVRRALWIICISLMMVPQPNLPFQLFAIDFTTYYEQMMHAAGILPREIADLVGDIRILRLLRDYSVSVTGLAYQNYPYLLGIILMIVPALFLQLGSYLRCRSRARKFRSVSDERILRIWKQVHHGARHLPLLLDSGSTPHPPVLFGFFRQKLLLPVGYIKTLSDSEVELLLVHEYIHYRSFDGIINIFTLCLWPFCWYNPFFLAARRRLRINCELACDAEVLKRFPERTAEYGRLLLSFANSARPPEVTMAFREYAGELRSRIIYMTRLPNRRKSSLGAVLLLTFLLAAPFGLFSAVTRQSGKSLPGGKEELLLPGEDSSAAMSCLLQKNAAFFPFRRSLLLPEQNSEYFKEFRKVYILPCCKKNLIFSSDCPIMFTVGENGGERGRHTDSPQ